MDTPDASLSALPAVILHEVVSWSPDSATARGLLEACHTMHHLRRDPAAVALLLTRCHSSNYEAALESCSRSCEGGTDAVSQQVLRLLTASADSGGPHLVPAQLLQAMLSCAATSGAVETVRHLLALPSPPDGNAALLLALHHQLEGGEDPALQLADGLERVPCLAGMDALLQCGVDPFAKGLHILHIAAGEPQHLLALQLLLRHCPEAARDEAAGGALQGAVEGDNVRGAEHLLGVLQPNYSDMMELLKHTNGYDGAHDRSECAIVLKRAMMQFLMQNRIRNYEDL